MKQRRVFITASERVANGIIFSPRNSHYLTHVLRLGTGDTVTALDAERRHAVRITEVRAGRVSGQVIRVDPVAILHGQEIHLAVACVRPGPFEEVLRHGTELGVARFIPIQSVRATRQPPTKKDRWQLIIEAAAAQCGRSSLPTVESPVPFHTFLDGDVRADLCVLLAPLPDAQPLLAVLEREPAASLLFLAGPEGGFDPSEEASALQRGFIPVELGPLVLRTETAAIAALATVVAWHQWERSRQ